MPATPGAEEAPLFAQTTLWLLLTVMLAACGSGAVGGDPQGSTADSGSFDTGLATQQEACDGYDNDSDGEVDEGCPCVPGQTAQCYPGAPGLASVGLCAFGTMTCEGGSELGHWGPCLGAITPRVEVCGNGVDEDCDGKDADCIVTNAREHASWSISDLRAACP